MIEVSIDLPKLGAEASVHGQTSHKQKFRVLHVITRLIRGGADENTIITCNAQADRGHEVALVYGREFSEAMLATVDPRIELIRCEHLVRHIDLWSDLMAMKEVVSIIGQWRPDIVHTHTSKAGIIGRIAARLCKTKVIIHGVHILPFLNVSPVGRIAYTALERFSDRFTDYYIAVSEGMRTACLSHGLGEGRIDVIRSGMDVAAFADARPYSSDELSHSLSISADEAKAAQIVLMIAALEGRKRHIPFIDIFNDVAARFPHARFVALGEGPGRSAIENAAKRAGVSDRVHLLGFSREPQRWIATAQVCVLASEREGLPRVVVQYAIGGKPIVCAHLPGIEEVVLNEKNGFVVPGDTLAGMSQRIEALLADPAHARAMGLAGRQIDFSRWGASEMTDQIEMIYHQTYLKKSAKAHV